jgi:DNA polymerase III subunit alpha
MTVNVEDYQGPTDFVHLNVHTVFSPLIGVASPDKYAEKCVEYGHNAIAVTEHGNMASVPDMYFACKKYGLKYIPGADLYWNDYEPFRQKYMAEGNKLHDLKNNNDDLLSRINKNRYLTVLCKNDEGFHNLVRLTTLAWKVGLYRKPRVWFDELVKYKEGLIILSGGLNGPIAHELFLDIDNLELDGEKHKRSKNDFSAIGYLKKFQAEFGSDFYVEVRMPCMPEMYDHKIFWALVVLAEKLGIKPVLTNACYYLEQRDQEIQKIMVAIDQNTNINDPNLVFQDTEERWFKSRADLWATFKNNDYSTGISDVHFNTMCDNTLEVAEKCEGLKPDTSPKIPDWSVIEAGVDADKELRKIVAKELLKRGLNKIKKKYMVDGQLVTYVDQAKIECDRFIDKGFASYFLITQDLIAFGRSKGWPFGPRGCSIPTSRVTMADNSLKSINEIDIGDTVLDGFGDKQIVENKFIYEVSEEMVNIEFDGGGVVVTADHKLYIVRDGNVMVVKASDIKDTDEIIDVRLGRKDNNEDQDSNL